MTTCPTTVDHLPNEIRCASQINCKQRLSFGFMMYYLARFLWSFIRCTLADSFHIPNHKRPETNKLHIGT